MAVCKLLSICTSRLFNTVRTDEICMSVSVLSVDG